MRKPRTPKQDPKSVIRCGETDAYLLGAMYDHFFSVLEKDKTK